MAFALKRIVAIVGITIWGVEVTPAQQQDNADAGQRVVRYRLIDMGTLGGPNSTDVSAPIMNNRGAITGGADTADMDPNAPNCYSPDCFVFHAYIWKHGVLADL